MLTAIIAQRSVENAGSFNRQQKVFSGEMTPTRILVVRWLTIMVVVAFLGVLGWYLGQPGYTRTRLVFFGILGGLAVTGATGVVFQRELVAAGSAFGLLLLGFWQAVLWMCLFPVIGILVVAIVVIAAQEQSDTAVTG